MNIHVREVRRIMIVDKSDYLLLHSNNKNSSTKKGECLKSDSKKLKIKISLMPA